MKPYYVMIHFGDKRQYVSGFIAPQAKDEQDAIRLIKKALLVRKALIIEAGKATYRGGELDFIRTNEFLKSLKRPWRINNRSPYTKTVRVVEMQLPIMSGYWLTDIITANHICNQRSA